MTGVAVEVFHPADKEAVIQLILAIQIEEFNVAISREEQPDLEDIETFYQRGKGNFWVAKADDVLVGTIALVDIGSDDVALRKMFVNKAFRGKTLGVAQMLLQTVFDWVSEQGIRRILLGTTAKFVAAQRFYEKNGFVETDEKCLPETFPRMKVDVRFYEYVVGV